MFFYLSYDFSGSIKISQFNERVLLNHINNLLKNKMFCFEEDKETKFNLTKLNAVSLNISH